MRKIIGFLFLLMHPHGAEIDDIESVAYEDGAEIGKLAVDLRERLHNVSAIGGGIGLGVKLSPLAFGHIDGSLAYASAEVGLVAIGIDRIGGVCLVELAEGAVGIAET